MFHKLFKQYFISNKIKEHIDNKYYNGLDFSTVCSESTTQQALQMDTMME